jgi:hypothetical protein
VGDRLGRPIAPTPSPDRLAAAHAFTVDALLSGEVAPGSEVARRTKRIVLSAAGVDGVRALDVQEMLSACVEGLGAWRGLTARLNSTSVLR